MILTHEAGRDGFWLARFLVRRDVEVHVMQSSSLPVDRRARRAKTDVIDVEISTRHSGNSLPRESLSSANRNRIDREPARCQSI